MRKLIRFLLFHEALTIVWAAGLTAAIVLIYQEFSQAKRIFLFWLVALQSIVVLRLVLRKKS